MLPPIGSMSSLAGQGRSGVVLSAQPIGEADEGRQLIALKIKEGADRQSAHAATAPVGGAGSVGSSSNDTSLPFAPHMRAVSAAARLPSELSVAEKADVARLQQRDQQVRQEEKAHAAVAGDLAGPISYHFQRGPDGRQYAIGGSVGIQASTLSGDPAEAERKAGRLAAAANAATNPSAQDYAVARQAYALGSQLGSPAPSDQGENGLSLAI